MKSETRVRIAWTLFKVALCAAVATVCYWSNEIVYVGICVLVAMHLLLDLLMESR